MMQIIALACVATTIVVQGADTNTATTNTTTITLISNATNVNTTMSPICENGGTCCNSQDLHCHDYQFEINGRKGKNFPCRIKYSDCKIED